MQAANDNRMYPPEECSAATMAYLLDIGESTFRSYVRAGHVPAGLQRGGVVRWNRVETLAAWRGFSAKKTTAATALKDDEQSQIMAAIEAHGAQAKRKR